MSTKHRNTKTPKHTPHASGYDSIAVRCMQQELYIKTLELQLEALHHELRSSAKAHELEPARSRLVLLKGGLPDATR